MFSAATNTFVERIGAGLFVGTAGGDNDVAGPNGIYLSNTGAGKILIAGNGTSNFLTFNLDPTGLNVIGTPRSTSTAVAGTPMPPNRVDGVAYAPNANTILAANNASNPGFLTLVNNATGAVVRSIPLDGTGGYPSVAGNGVEATVYNTARNTYFVAVPTLSVDSSGNPADGRGVIELDATTGNLLSTFNFNTLGLTGACSPTGLTQGAGAAVFVACSDSTAGRSVLLDPTRNVFFEAARFQPGGPVVGIIDGTTLAVQTLVTAANDHAVAVDPVSGEVFLAENATTNIPNCTNGCIAVFTPVPEPATLPLIAMGLLAPGAVRRRKLP